MRMSMRRFTRLSNGFSRKTENHASSVAIHFMYYNFVRIHQSLRVTPAMAAGVTANLSSITDWSGSLKRARIFDLARFWSDDFWDQRADK
jgi:hypothetical protein